MAPLIRVDVICIHVEKLPGSAADCEWLRGTVINFRCTTECCSLLVEDLRENYIERKTSRLARHFREQAAVCRNETRNSELGTNRAKAESVSHFREGSPRLAKKTKKRIFNTTLRAAYFSRRESWQAGDCRRRRFWSAVEIDSNQGERKLL